MARTALNWIVLAGEHPVRHPIRPCAHEERLTPQVTAA